MSSTVFAKTEAINANSKKNEAIKSLNVELSDISESNLKELDVKTTREKEEYIDKIIYLIKTKWKDHSHRFSITGSFTTSTTFTINNQGVLENKKIVRSSGNKDFDNLVYSFLNDLPNHGQFSNNTNESFFNIPCDFTYTQKRDDYGVYVKQEMKYLNDQYRRYQAYMDEVSKLIDKKWRPDVNNLKVEKCLKTVLDFKVHRKGEISKVKVFSSSENKKFDKSIVKFISKMIFPAIPKEIDDQHLDMKYTFQYHCNDEVSSGFES